MTQSTITEATVEQAALAWLEDLGYETLHGPDIGPEGESQKRASFSETILEEELRAKLAEINRHLPARVIGSVIDEAYRRVSVTASPDLYEDNRIFHDRLVNGVEVEYKRVDGGIAGDKVWLIDFEEPARNSFSAVRQYTVIEGGQKRRPDIVVFVNGIPLAVIELKNAVDEGATIHHAYNQLQTYKSEIPSLFRTNALLVISDGLEARLGSLTASREWFLSWRTIDGLQIAPKGSAELETLLRGLFEKSVLLDMIQNFTVFEKDGASVVKKIAAYHQYHAVNMAVGCTISAAAGDGDRRAGVVWHTQGSGKSLSMAFYAGKIIRQRQMENPTLLVLTDRNDLDDQLFGAFCHCEGLLRQTPAQARDRRHLKELLSVAAGGVVFTTIQKFAPEKGSAYPLLSDRRNIVVIADEAHRSQYDFIDGFARHLRDGLPHASFIGFTGTPIALSDRDTYAVFGENIHTYDIQQAVEDGATVRIYYESRLVALELDESAKPHIEADFQEATKGEEVERTEQLKRRWTRLEALVGAEKRIELIAQDLVDHFERRVEALEGKGMAVCMSRRICVALYSAIIRLRPEWHDDDDRKGAIKVVMTGSVGDPKAFQPHIRSKAGREVLARRMKDPTDPLALVIVRDMWLTGFDAPPLHTMYVDKPMRGHGLMQSIARVNRVFRDKPGGLVVDYIGILDKLKSALDDYSDRDRSEAGVPQGEAIEVMLEKYELAKELFRGFDYSAAIGDRPEERLKVIPMAMEHILSQEEGRERFMQLSLDLSKAFALCAAADEARRIRDEVGFFQNIRSALSKSTGGSGRDEADLNTALQQLVSKAVASTEVVDILAAAGLRSPDISILSEEFLAELRGMKQKNLALEMLKRLLKEEIGRRAKKNVVQARNFIRMLEAAIQKCQERLIETAQAIEELIDLAKEMGAAQNRGQALGLKDDESAFYDVLADNSIIRETAGDRQLGVVARELTDTIKQNISTDWTIRESARARIKVVVKHTLRKYDYPPELREEVTQTVLEQAELLASEWAA